MFFLVMDLPLVRRDSCSGFGFWGKTFSRRRVYECHNSRLCCTWRPTAAKKERLARCSMCVLASETRWYRTTELLRTRLRLQSRSVLSLDLLALNDLRNDLLEILLRQPQHLITQRLRTLKITSPPLPISRRQDQGFDPRIILLGHLLPSKLRQLRRRRLDHFPLLVRSLLERG